MDTLITTQPEAKAIHTASPNASMDTVAALVATAFAAALLVLTALNAGPLWRDETNSLNMAQMPSLRELWNNLPFDSVPLLWLLLLRLWSFFGLADSDLGVRIFGLLIGLSFLGSLWLCARWVTSILFHGPDQSCLRDGDVPAGNDVRADLEGGGGAHQVEDRASWLGGAAFCPLRLLRCDLPVCNAARGCVCGSATRALERIRSACYYRRGGRPLPYNLCSRYTPSVGISPHVAVAILQVFYYLEAAWRGSDVAEHQQGRVAGTGDLALGVAGVRWHRHRRSHAVALGLEKELTGDLIWEWSVSSRLGIIQLRDRVMRRVGISLVSPQFEISDTLVVLPWVVELVRDLP
jgi:hypothetical protein